MAGGAVFGRDLRMRCEVVEAEGRLTRAEPLGRGLRLMEPQVRRMLKRARMGRHPVMGSFAVVALGAAMLVVATPGSASTALTAAPIAVFAPCGPTAGPGARCGTVAVPLDRVRPSAGTIAIAFQFYPATDASAAGVKHDRVLEWRTRDIEPLRRRALARQVTAAVESFQLPGDRSSGNWRLRGDPLSGVAACAGQPGHRGQGVRR